MLLVSRYFLLFLNRLTLLGFSRFLRFRLFLFSYPLFPFRYRFPLRRGLSRIDAAGIPAPRIYAVRQA